MIYRTARPSLGRIAIEDGPYRASQELEQQMHLLDFREFDGYECDRFEQYMGKPLFWPVHARGEPDREKAIRLAASRWSRGLRARYYWTFGIEKHGLRWLIPNAVAAARDRLYKLCRSRYVAPIR